MVNKLDIDPITHPYVYDGVEYAKDVLAGKIVACVYVIGACNRFFKDIDKGYFIFDIDKAERYLRLVQLFNHVKGVWSTPNITYDPWQNFCFMNIMGWVDPRTGSRRFRSAHLELARGQGKPHTLRQTVVTPEGVKKWGDIEVGSRLFARDGTICNVVGKTPITKQRVWEVEFSDGSVVECAEAHEWFTSTKTERKRERLHKTIPPKRFNKSGKLVVNTAYESVRETKHIRDTLKQGKDSNHVVYLTDVLEGETKLKSGINPYYLGYWLGNGHKDISKLSCHLEDILEVCEYVGGEQRLDGRGGNRGIVTVPGGILQLRDNVDTLTKNFKTEWVNLNREDRLSLLQGLLDSDGTIDERQGIVEFYNGNYSLVLGVKLLACSFGFKATISEKKVSDKNNFRPSKTHYRVQFSARGEIPLFRLKRKRERQISKRGKHSYADKRYIVDVRETDRFEDQFCVEVDSKDHSYLIGDSLIPTHNSAMASQAVLFFLALDNPVGNEISCVSTKKDAARIVLDSARAMAKKSKKYLQKTNVKVLAHKIVHDESNSFARALSSDSESLDGLNDILAVMDELHAVQRKLFDVINSGMKKRRDSLMLCITTAGFNKDGVGYSQSQYAKKVALGEVEDDQMFAIVYTLDKGDDIYDSKNWIKANPSLGTSVDPIALEAAIKKTREVPADLPNVMVKNLNIWLDEANAYFSMDKWDECYDPTLDEKDFYKHTCFEAIDLSSKVDLSAKVKVFFDPTDGKYAIFQKAYIPRETFKESNSDIYAQSEGNELFVTEGSAIDYSAIERDIEQDSTTTTLDSVFFDPWNAIHISQNLTKKGLNMVEFPQRVSTMSEPMKHLEALIREKKIKHNGGPLLRYCMANVVAKIDGNENVFPTKSSKLLKIDLAVALIMAMAGWLVREQTEKSVYESRGLRTL